MAVQDRIVMQNSYIYHFVAYVKCIEKNTSVFETCEAKVTDGHASTEISIFTQIENAPFFYRAVTESDLFIRTFS